MTDRSITLTLADEAATLALGQRLAQCVRAGDLIALTGDLGAGKTTVSRGLIRALAGAGTDVPSPTFTLVQRYDAADDARPSVLHFDLYRLQQADEVWELGWEDMGDAVALVEWPDRAGSLLPADRLDVTLSFVDQSVRQAYIRAGALSSWNDRLDAL